MKKVTKKFIGLLALVFTMSFTGNAQEIVALTFAIVDADGTEWITSNSFVVNAPSLEFSSYEFSSGSCVISLGETVDLIFVLDNIGHAASESGSVTVITDFSSLGFSLDEIPFSVIEEDGQYLVVVPVTLDAVAPLGMDYFISLNAVSLDGFSSDYTVNFTSPNCSAESAEVQIGLATDGYANETSWILTNAFGEIVNEVTSNDLESDQTYSDLYCMEPNTYYTFEIDDTYGDGLSSAGYSLTVYNQTIAGGSDFGNGETVSFIAGCDQSLELGCTDPTASNYSLDAIVDDGSCMTIGLDEMTTNIHVFPNPAKNILKINTGTLNVSTISLVQMDGKEVKSLSSLGSQIELNISNLDAGYYLMKIELENGLTVTKSIIVM